MPRSVESAAVQAIFEFEHVAVGEDVVQMHAGGRTYQVRVQSSPFVEERMPVILPAHPMGSTNSDRHLTLLAIQPRLGRRFLRQVPDLHA